VPLFKVPFARRSSTKGWPCTWTKPLALELVERIALVVRCQVESYSDSPLRRPFPRCPTVQDHFGISPVTVPLRLGRRNASPDFRARPHFRRIPKLATNAGRIAS